MGEINPISTPHVMVDIETLGKTPGSVILSIGAVAFNPELGVIGPRFYFNVDRASCEALGLTTDADTVEWWSKQSPEAQRALEVTPAPLAVALAEFSAFWTMVKGRRLWAHGATFDPPMLEAAYRAAGVEVPWRYSDPRDTRTIYELADVAPNRAAGVHHDALCDAEAQAEAVIAAYDKLGLVPVRTQVRIEIQRMREGLPELIRKTVQDALDRRTVIPR